MNPTDILNTLFQYSLLHLYAPIISQVGFSHPLTFVIITAHNTFSLTYLLLAASIAYPIMHGKTWLIPASVAAFWVIISVNVAATLDIPITTAVAAVFPHGWLEFTAIAYWTNALREATHSNTPPTPVDSPTLKDYFNALVKPKKFVALVKTDIQTSFKATKTSLKILSRNLKRAYITTLILIAAAALIETYVTPYIMLLVNNL